MRITSLRLAVIVRRRVLTWRGVKIRRRNLSRAVTPGLPSAAHLTAVWSASGEQHEKLRPTLLFGSVYSRAHHPGLCRGYANHGHVTAARAASDGHAERRHTNRRHGASGDE